ncbi:uncharacterized protein BDW70DRAFT_137391 [Aspergillus foveolatus]|uniref:uncharacterized protein n=1 Tax=Aspergillus foveolatus TaxID=210207 RepID=UPI003CCCB79E
MLYMSFCIIGAHLGRGLSGSSARTATTVSELTQRLSRKAFNLAYMRGVGRVRDLSSWYRFALEWLRPRKGCMTCISRTKGPEEESSNC